MIYGSSSYPADRGTTWAKSKVSHLDFGGVGWAAAGKRLLAIRPESGGIFPPKNSRGFRTTTDTIPHRWSP